MFGCPCRKTSAPPQQQQQRQVHMSSYHQSLRGGERDRDSDRDRSRTDRDGRQPVQSDYERSAQRAGADQGEPRSRDREESSRSRLRTTAQVVHDDGRGSMYNNNSGPSMQLPPPPSHGGGEGRFFQSPPIPMHSVAYQPSGAAGSREGRFEQAGASRTAGGSNLNASGLGTRGSYHQEQATSMSNKSHPYSPDNYAGGGRASGVGCYGYQVSGISDWTAGLPLPGKLVQTINATSSCVGLYSCTSLAFSAPSHPAVLQCLTAT